MTTEKPRKHAVTASILETRIKKLVTTIRRKEGEQERGRERGWGGRGESDGEKRKKVLKELGAEREQ